jgi:hypothetical protein
MIVFVETNFLLELVLMHGEASAVSKLIEFASKKKIELVIPSFSMIEPHYKLEGDRRVRTRLLASIDEQVGQIARSKGFESLRDQSISLLKALAHKADADKMNFDTVTQRVIGLATVIPLTVDVLKRAIVWQAMDLEPFDALVFASIEIHLQANPTDECIFASKDKKAFLQQAVSNALKSLGCTVIPTFTNAVGFVEARIPADP